MFIDAEGVRFNPMNMSGLKDGEASKNSEDLCEYYHALSCISTSIPLFAGRVKLKFDLLELSYHRAGGSRKKIR